jgi:hypothetical protein
MQQKIRNEMKHIRTFESYKSVKNKLGIVNDSVLVDAIKESVLQVGDLYKVRSMVDIPQSLINSYVKKVKDTTGKNLRQFFGDVEIAEQLVQYITTNGLDIEKIPGNALMGGAQSQAQSASGAQVQTQAETGEAQAPVEGQAQDQAQAPVEGQAQAQAQAPVQAQTQGQAQPAAEEFEEPIEGQAQGQAQAPVQGQEEEEEEEEEEEAGEEELPL